MSKGWRHSPALLLLVVEEQRFSAASKIKKENVKEIGQIARCPRCVKVHASCTRGINGDTISRARFCPSIVIRYKE